MKLLSLQGHFGNMNGRKIEFQDGFSHLVLPNGWGKTTLCAFIRVMLYGLNTSRRDTANALSDKTRYVPQDGHAMSGRLEIEWNGRRVTITRMTGKGGPMQDFDAFYTDTGEKCRLLTAKNCGQVLLGMGEDAFLSSMMVDGEDVNRPSNELQELIVAMAQSGDTGGRCAQTVRTLDRWRLDIDSGNGHGLRPALQEKLSELENRREQLDRLRAEQEEAQAHCAALEQTERETQQAYEESYRAYAEQMAGAGRRLDILREEHEQRIREITERIPDENLVREAGEALYGYEGAVRLEKEKREVLPALEARYDQAVRQIEQSKTQREIEVNRNGRPRVRWIAAFFAAAFAVSAAATGVFEIEWFPYMPYVLSALTVACLLLAFVGSVPKPPAPDTDLEDARKQLKVDYQRMLDDQQMAASVLQEERRRVIEAAKRFRPEVETVEQAAAAIRAGLADVQLLRREQSALGDVILRAERAQTAGDIDPSRKRAADQAQTRYQEAKRLAEEARETVSRLRGQAEAIGDPARLEAQIEKTLEELDVLARKHEAVCRAKQIIEQENAALSARISPQITSLASAYLSYLTTDHYQEIRLDDKLRARTAGADGQLLGELQLSSGTRDQLYLALRLAICEVLSGAKDAPLILDDPFLTSDDVRTARGIALLRELSRHRQIILLTCRKGD